MSTLSPTLTTLLFIVINIYFRAIISGGGEVLFGIVIIHICFNEHPNKYYIHNPFYEIINVYLPPLLNRQSNLADLLDANTLSEIQAPQ